MLFVNKHIKLKPHYSYLFQGRNFDAETRNYYFRTRYNPEHGAFLSIDTIGTWADENNLGNPYAFLGNNPWSGTDPFGECKWYQVACKAKRAATKLVVNSIIIPTATIISHEIWRRSYGDFNMDVCEDNLLVGGAAGIAAGTAAVIIASIYSVGLGTLVWLSGMVFLAASAASFATNEDSRGEDFCTASGFWLGATAAPLFLWIVNEVIVLSAALIASTAEA